MSPPVTPEPVSVFALEECFAQAMAAMGPFEPAPLLAVGVSGGADSLALCLLASEWARARGGRAAALSVDHGLRVEAAGEVAQLARRLEAAGVACHALRVTAAAPRADVQAWARARRFELLEGWCRDNGCLHLLLAHHARDQAETVLLRLARGSGVSGLAGMAPAAPRPWGRIVRPLLAAPPEALRLFLRRRGQNWVEDPSNGDVRYARVRMRLLLPSLAAEGADVRRLAQTAVRLARGRQALEDQTDALLARAAWVHPLGFATLDPRPLAAAAADVALRALSWLTQAIGGRTYGPRLALLERALKRLETAQTLGGCRFIPRADGSVAVVREARRLPTTTLRAGETVLWDGRFRIALAEGEPEARLAPLKASDWRRLQQGTPEKRKKELPFAIASSLPSIWRNGAILGVPGIEAWVGAPPRLIGPVFAPPHPVGSVRFRLAVCPARAI